MHGIPRADQGLGLGSGLGFGVKRVRVNPSRCSVRLSNSQDVSLIQRVLMTLVLRLLMNGGFSFDSANRVF